MSRTNDNLLSITPECLLFSPRSKARGSAREFVRGLSNVLASLTELEISMGLCLDLGYSDEREERRLVARLRRLKRSVALLLRRLEALLSGNRLQLISEEIAALISKEEADRSADRH